MPAAPADEQKAAELAWNRRQSATTVRAKNSVGASGAIRPGENFSARNLLALGKNQTGNGKPIEQKLREEGGKQLGRWAGGALAGFLTAGLGAPIGAFIGGLLGKKVGGSVVGKVIVIGLVLAIILAMIAMPIAGIFAFCNQYRLTLAAASYVNDNANSLYTVCKSFYP